MSLDENLTKLTGYMTQFGDGPICIASTVKMYQPVMVVPLRPSRLLT